MIFQLQEWNKNDDKLVRCVETEDLAKIEKILNDPKKQVSATKLDPQGHTA